MSTDTTPLTDDLHSAMCRAVASLNEGREQEASAVLRQALVDYADAIAATPKAPDPEPTLWLMRDNHTFLRLPLHVDDAMKAIQNDHWQYGMLTRGDFDRNAPPLHLHTEWPEQDVLRWLIDSVAAALAQRPAEPALPPQQQPDLLWQQRAGTTQGPPAARSVEEPKSQPALDHQAQAVAQSPEAADADREEAEDLIHWAYSKLHRREFADLDDALNLDRMKLRLMTQKTQRAVTDAFGLDENGRLSTAPEAVAKRAELMTKKAEGL